MNHPYISLGSCVVYISMLVSFIFYGLGASCIDERFSTCQGFHFKLVQVNALVRVITIKSSGYQGVSIQLNLNTFGIR